MTQVVLINWGTSRLEESIRREHLGLAYLCAFLTRAGYTVTFLDDVILGYDEDGLARRVFAEDPSLVGFSVFLTNAAAVLHLVERLRRDGLKAHITLGGHHATFNCREILLDNPGVDSIVMGEGEEALAELVGRIITGRPWHDVANLALPDPVAGIVCNPCRPLLNDLDALPFPSRQPYTEALATARVAAMVSSRGCYANCGFCSIRAFYHLASGSPWRMRSPANVVDEMQALAAEYGVESITFLDDNFLGPGARGRQRAQAIAGELLARRLAMSWTIACRANDVHAETLQALQRAGLQRVDLGVESWIPRQLALYNKGITSEQNERAVETLQRLGLEYRLYVIPLDPYVTPDELLQNVAHMRQQGITHLPPPFFTRLAALKGTDLAERIKRDGLLSESPGRKAYEGALPYAFSEPIMNEVAASLDQLDGALSTAVRRVKSIFSWTQCNAMERAFAEDLLQALGEAALDLAEDVVSAYQEGCPAEAVRLVEGGLAEISAGLDLVADARETGQFARFATVHVAVRGRSATYPLPEMRRLVDAFLAGCPRPLDERNR